MAKKRTESPITSAQAEQVVESRQGVPLYGYLYLADNDGKFTPSIRARLVSMHAIPQEQLIALQLGTLTEQQRKELAADYGIQFLDWIHYVQKALAIAADLLDETGDRHKQSFAALLREVQELKRPLALLPHHSSNASTDETP